MEYSLPDNSGVNHDLPRSKQRKFPGRGRGFLHRRPVLGSGQFPPAQIDMEAQIHQVEQEAYTSVLRAFKAQSDAITWEKESLITELRKELRVSDEEHRELLSKVNAEEIINEIREWRAAGGLQPVMPSISRPVHDREPHPTVSASRKKTKISQAAMSLEVPPSMWSQPVQPSAFRASTKGQKTKPPEDVRWNGQDQGITHGIGRSGASRGGSQKSAPLGRKGGKSFKGDSGNHIPASLNGTERDSFGVIEIMNTDTLIKEVEQFLSAKHTDPAELEKVMKVVKDHERDLMDAIAKLDHASDGESGNN